MRWLSRFSRRSLLSFQPGETNARKTAQVSSVDTVSRSTFRGGTVNCDLAPSTAVMRPVFFRYDMGECIPVSNGFSRDATWTFATTIWCRELPLLYFVPSPAFPWDVGAKADPQDLRLVVSPPPPHFERLTPRLQPHKSCRCYLTTDCSVVMARVHHPPLCVVHG